jgi:hypothetical protein
VIDAVATAGRAVIEGWRGVEEFFATMWRNIAANFKDAWDKISPVVNAVKGAASWFGGVVGGAVNAVGGAIERHNEAAAAAPQTFTPGPAALLPPLYGAGGATAAPASAGVAGAPGAAGTVHVKVDLNNAPPGTRAQTTTSGATTSETNVGYANPMAYGF